MKKELERMKNTSQIKGNRGCVWVEVGKAWSALSQTQKNEWNMQAKISLSDCHVGSYRRSNRKCQSISSWYKTQGNKRRLSGFQLFMKNIHTLSNYHDKKFSLIVVAGEWNSLTQNQRDHWNLLAQKRIKHGYQLFFVKKMADLKALNVISSDCVKEVGSAWSQLSLDEKNHWDQLAKGHC